MHKGPNFTTTTKLLCHRPQGGSQKTGHPKRWKNQFTQKCDSSRPTGPKLVHDADVAAADDDANNSDNDDDDTTEC
jgi:hypothetical protein